LAVQASPDYDYVAGGKKKLTTKAPRHEGFQEAENAYPKFRQEVRFKDAPSFGYKSFMPLSNLFVQSFVPLCLRG
jgi:hypothetical protein